MFPLKADDPYINKDGSRTTLGNITGDISGIIGDIDDLDDRLDKVADSVTPISQTGTKATAAITSGSYFYLDGVLVKAIANIAIDDTFTANTNYEVVTAGGLNALASQISNLDTNISNIKSYQLEFQDSLASSDDRATGSSQQLKTRTINTPGVYVLIAVTTAQNYLGRSHAYFDTTGGLLTSTGPMFPPTLNSSGFNYSQMVQFLFLGSGSATLSLRYFDEKSTGAEHDYYCYRIAKY